MQNGQGRLHRRVDESQTNLIDGGSAPACVLPPDQPGPSPIRVTSPRGETPELRRMMVAAPRQSLQNSSVAATVAALPSCGRDLNPQVLHFQHQRRAGSDLYSPNRQK